MLGTLAGTATVLLGMVLGALERPQMVSSSYVTSFAGERERPCEVSGVIYLCAPL